MAASGTGVFATPGFARLWTADTISGFGSPVTMLAVQTLVLLGLHGSAADVGLVTAARWLPYLVLGVVVGAVVDRHARLPVMVATDAALGVVLLAIPALWFADLLSLPMLIGVMVVFGLLTLFGDAASQSVFPRVVPPHQLQEANARLDQSGAVAQVGGPAIAGALVAVIGAATSVLLDAVSYFVSALLVRSIRLEEPRRARGSAHPRLHAQIREGLAWVYRQPKLGSLAVLTHAWFVCNAMLTPVFASLVLLSLRASPLSLGIALGAAGLGSLVGASVTTRVGRHLDAGPTIILSHGITTCGVAILAVGAATGRAWSTPAIIALLSVGQALHGFAMGMSNSHEMGYRQMITPDALQARTNTTMRSINRAMVVIAAPLGGVLFDALGATTTLIIIAAGFGAVAAVMWASPVRHAAYADAGHS